MTRIETSPGSSSVAPYAPAGAVADGSQDGREEIRIVVGELALDHRRDALEPHPRVDGRRREGRERAVRLTVELHEHVVPDLDEPVAVAVDAEALPAAPLLVAGDVFAAEVVNLGAPAAGTGLAHRPEVLGQPKLRDPLPGHELRPDRVRVGVARNARIPLEDRREETVRSELPRSGEELPRKRNGRVLEVITEGEVSQHLEERVMPERRPDVVEVVVLAADPHALLRRCRARIGPLLAAEKRVLELVHSRVREEERRIVARHERGARDDGVSLTLEVVKEAGSDVARVHVFCSGLRAQGSGLRAQGSR